ncbi:MAG: BlaI/MecI/CopY family transcriptional regulator [Bacteroidales bacterium]|nr:BlaI/MecI/CopY family transcriptional regulator [Bacteroidales bacterium]MCM1415275.1 BlaI/MecI/CopY family transcriptional regulator [bacterium]MCM1424441.1 BlaI/MecI/CopY family transcriptional regulator [bacterium]
MKNKWDASDAELEVLEKLWDQEEGIKQSQLLALFEADGKEWKRQTLNTFLARLEEKGLVTRKRRIVSTTYSRDEYHYKKAKAVIDEMYEGKLSHFMAAFVKENTIDESEAEELIRIIENN